MKISAKSALMFGALTVSGCATAQDGGKQLNQPEATPAKRPNIIFILTDDHSSQAISAYGSKLMPTPNIDRIANEGMRFNNCFCTNAICAPSRAVILSGRHSHLNGVRTWQAFNGSKQPTLQKSLHDAGYYTALVGKWHLENVPVGFDHWQILIGQGPYFNPDFLMRPDTASYADDDGAKNAARNSKRIKTKGYSTNIITDEAFKCLDNRPQDKPFFLALWHKAPHRTWVRDPKYKDLFKGVDLPEPETLFDDYATRRYAKNAEMRMTDLRPNYDIKVKPPFDYKPFQGSTDSSQIRWLYQQYIKDYMACIKSVDDNVGRVFKYLEDNDLLDNTMIVYSSDQGFYLGENSWFDKRWMYDISMRMPLLMRLPGVIPAGRVDTSIVANLDFAPTFLDLARAQIPETMQGASMTPLFGTSAQKDWRNAHYYRYYDPAEHRVEPHYGIRTHEYKLMKFPRAEDGYVELFDLVKDPKELKNVADDPAYASVRAKLETELAALRKQYKDND